MLDTNICHGCDQRLSDASKAMRRHASVMNTAIRVAKNGPTPTEERRKHFRNRLETSFNDAQLAWDAYRLHLIEHGLLPAR